MGCRLVEKQHPSTGLLNREESICISTPMTRERKVCSVTFSLLDTHIILLFLLLRIFLSTSSVIGRSILHESTSSLHAHGVVLPVCTSSTKNDTTSIETDEVTHIIS